MLIYVASPYTSGDDMVRLNRVESSMAVGRDILALGHYPVIPLLNHWFHLFCEREGIPQPSYDEYIAWGLALQQRCDAVFFRPGWENSKGCRLEDRQADRDNQPKYYRLIDIPKGDEWP